MIEHITKKDFEEKVIKNSKAVLVDFFATWCGPCQMLGPVLEKISEERDDFDIYKVDIDEEMELAMEEKVEVVPTMVIFKGGEEKNRIEGFLSKSELLEQIEKYI